MFQHSNVECNIQMFIQCNKMMYFGDFAALSVRKVWQIWRVTCDSPNFNQQILVYKWYPYG